MPERKNVSDSYSKYLVDEMFRYLKVNRLKLLANCNFLLSYELCYQVKPMLLYFPQ